LKKAGAYRVQHLTMTHCEGMLPADLP
jgi:hypothetical protein